ncbi:tRNA (adenosine(37)-N6)-threonylcarbamoyltransferase complex ATPase subunit type 1 TsaE [Paracoccus sp. p4-l81]|uniref:tRNA (adenosine(37)-N6)-threonylcarbamoyltransferase complex ATPase subunit type 1 TsaE n=1 Tax=Paracoccus sp. p4-l81 TaxID=3342806 RepID=UPI0035B8B2E4
MSCAPVDLTLDLPDPAASDALALAIEPWLRPGDTLLLNGPVGAGKSHLARALIAARLARHGQAEDIPSPTFTLVQTYQAAADEIWHADLYRLTGPDEVAELGLDQAMGQAICLIEWPDRLGDGTPPEALHVDLTVVESAGAALPGRRARLVGPARWAPMLGVAAVAVARSVQISAFLARHHWGDAARQPLAGDASARRYLRLWRDDGRRAILMDAPPGTCGSPAPFLRMTDWLRGHGYSAPEVLAADPETGLILLEDLGDRLLAHELARLPQPQPTAQSHDGDQADTVWKGAGEPDRTGTGANRPDEPCHDSDKAAAAAEGACEPVAAPDGAVTSNLHPTAQAARAGRLFPHPDRPQCGIVNADLPGGEPDRMPPDDPAVPRTTPPAQPLSEPAAYRALTLLLADLHRHAPPDGLTVLTPETLGQMTRIAADWYATAQPGDSAPGTSPAADALEAAIRAAADRLLDGAMVLALRDFHAENIILLDRPGPAALGLLDYQDAVLAHPAYDLASALQDARRDVPPAIEAAERAHYAALTGADPDRFAAAYALVAAQRNLRILGVFARLCRAGGKAGYVALLPRVWGYVQRNLAHPALADLARVVAAHLPAPTDDRLDQMRAECGQHPMR